MICGPWRADLPPETAQVLSNNRFRSQWSKRWREIVRADPCAWCGDAGGYIDHIVPQSRCNAGRRKSWMNLTGTCAKCNGRRGDAPVLQWLADPETAAAAAKATRRREDPRQLLLSRLRRALVRRAWIVRRTATAAGRRQGPERVDAPASTDITLERRPQTPTTFHAALDAAAQPPPHSMPMQPPKTCDYCRQRPADQTLFTSFMRCGEGDATKRNAHLCERCRHHAMLVLDRIGMTIAFEGDGQLRWDAHIKLADTATRSLARHAMQREDLLLHFDDPSAAARAPEAAEPEKLSLIHQLAVEEGLVESEINRGREFWPEDPCRLTASGQEAAALIRERRRAEADGLPIREWSPRYVPEQGTDEEFREYATRVVISPDGDRYDGSDHLMLRQNGNRAPSVDITSEPRSHLLFESDLWTSRPIRPVGYFFFDAIPVIAFDADDMQILAEHYELAKAVAGPGVRWTLIDPTPANPMHPNGEAARMIRADGPGTTAAAFASIFRPPGERPGIRMLRKRPR